MDEKHVDYEKALADPRGVFGTPEKLVEHKGLKRKQKIEILTRWSYDEAELAVATEEGMGDGEESLQDRVARALDELAGDADQPEVPTKHGV